MLRTQAQAYFTMVHKTSCVLKHLVAKRQLRPAPKELVSFDRGLKTSLSLVGSYRKPVGPLTRIWGAFKLFPSCGLQRALGEVVRGLRGWQWVCRESCSALWLSQNKRDYFHKSSHFHAYFPLCPDLCNYGMHMCGKEPWKTHSCSLSRS